MKERRTVQFAMLAAALGGLVWGVFWIPLRALDQAGVSGVWAVVLFQLVPTLFLVPILALRWRQIAAGGLSLHVAGILAGTSLVLYAGALIYTDVIKALLFFYLTPLWSTLLARLVLKEKITAVRWGTIGLALIGLLLILDVDQGLSGSLNQGDLMGLASGIVWALAAVWMNSAPKANATDFTLSYFVWGSLAALCLALLPLEGAVAPPAWPELREVLVWLVPLAPILIIPPAFAVIWGATVLSPGLLCLLFMTEISAGTITAAIWAGEPFGWRQVAGVIMITTAGILEPVMGAIRPPEPLRRMPPG